MTTVINLDTSVSDQSEMEDPEEDTGDAITKPPSTSTYNPTYCVACGALSTHLRDNGSSTVIKTEVEDDQFTEGFEDNHSFPCAQNSLSSRPPEEERVTRERRGQPPEERLFQQFCKLLGVKLSGVRRSKRETDNLDGESRDSLFCGICRSRLEFLVDLQDKLKELERDFNKELKEFKLMCQQSEETFEDGEAYKTDKIYSKIRTQLCGRKRKQGGNTTESPVERPTRKSSRNAALKLRAQMPASPPEEEEVRIKEEPEIPPRNGIDDGDDDVCFEVHFEEAVESPPEEPPAKKRKVKTPSNKRLKPAKRRLPARKKEKRISTVKRGVSNPRRKSTMVSAPSPPKRQSARRHSDYAPSEDDEDDDGNDSEEDTEASLKGRMTTDPTTGHVLFLHVSFKTLENGRYQCLTCNSGFTYHRASLKKHVITMHTDMFVCQECGQHCPSTKHLTSHIRRVHRGEDRITVECPTCGKPCSSKRGRMEKHQVTHMSPQEKEEVVARGETIPQWSKVRRHVCEICGMSYEMKSYLTQHKIREHPNLEFTHDDMMACKEMCPDCGKLVHKHYLKKHQELVHSEGTTKRFCCTICSKRFSKANELLRHRNVVHEKIKPFECPLCPKQFALKNQLNYHLDNHKNIRPYECDHCHMAFARKHHLERHVKTYHEPGANPKRKTYVRGPETKAKSDKEIARGNALFKEREEEPHI